jgi:hypothetical protein
MAAHGAACGALMSIQMILAPLFVQVVLTFAVGFWLPAIGIPALRRGEADPRNVALREPNWPTRVLQVRNSYQNQLELPILFYVLTILAVITKHADLLFVVMAWIFVLSRLVHAYIHVTSNDMRLRGPWFGVGAFTLAIMWIIFMVRILLGLP